MTVADGGHATQTCAVERCRLQPLGGPTSLEIGDEQLEVWLCSFHATSLANDLSWLRSRAMEPEADGL